MARQGAVVHTGTALAGLQCSADSPNINTHYTVTSDKDHVL